MPPRRPTASPRGPRRGARGERKGPPREGRSDFESTGGPRGRFYRRKLNRFFVVFPEGSHQVDFKDTERLSKFLTEKGKVLPRRITGLTAKQQKMLARAIKRARHSGLIAFQVD